MYSEITDPLILDQERFHCPILLLLKFRRPIVKTSKRKNLELRSSGFQSLSKSNIENDIETNNNIDLSVELISKVSADASEKAIPHTNVNIRPKYHP